jgi:hypothetical protein
MLDGVNYCHIAGVAHRDLKLENVLLNAEGKLKLIDFGLSHVYPVNRSTGFVDRSKPLRDVCGSKSYAAPEVLAAKGYDGFAADMWSLGVCLFAMLSGFFPLDEATEQDWRFPRLHVAQSHGASTVPQEGLFGLIRRGSNGGVVGERSVIEPAEPAQQVRTHCVEHVEAVERQRVDHRERGERVDEHRRAILRGGVVGQHDGEALQPSVLVEELLPVHGEEVCGEEGARHYA